MTTAARRAAARATAAALAGAAILHAAWAAGSTFPESSGRALAESSFSPSVSQQWAELFEELR